MLRYVDVHLSTLEVPDEISLCIYISGCLNRCMDCHSPELQRTDYGGPLSENISDLVELYLTQITCLCFLGEGRNSQEERNELIKYSDYAHKKGLRTCLYPGRDTYIEEWMKTFDYIKTGAFDIKRGGLTEKSTNQLMFQKSGGNYINITSKFWPELLSCDHRG